MTDCTLLVKRGSKCSKRNWLSLQEQAGFWTPKLERTEFELNCYDYDAEIWMREIKEHKCVAHEVKS